MKEAVATKRKIRVSPAVAFGSKFGKYKPEEEKEVRKLTVKEDEVLKQLKAAWKKFKYGKVEAFDDNYRNALKLVKCIDYSAKDVERFSLALVEFQDEENFSDRQAISSMLSSTWAKTLSMSFIQAT